MPPIAVLASSRGGRIVASEISVTGNCSGGGFNANVANATATKVGHRAATERDSVDGKKGRRTRTRDGADGWNSKGRSWERAGMARHGKIDLTAKKNRINSRGGPGSWDRTSSLAVTDSWNSNEGERVSSFGSAFQATKDVSLGGTSYCSHGSTFSPSSGVVVSSSCASHGGSGVRIENLQGDSLTSLTGGDVVPKRHALTAESVLWIPSRRKLRLTSSSRAPRQDRLGQGETIRRLVHMGLL